MRKEGKRFCCQGCLFVHELLAESGLAHFYELSQHPGVQVAQPARARHWAYLDEPSVGVRIVDFTDGHTSRVTLHIPAIHCIACVWLLENLFRLREGIGRSTVNFARREVTILFEPGRLRLGELAAFLASIGYEPKFTLGELDARPTDSVKKRHWLQVGIAGFAFGNIMLFSLPAYIGLDSFNGPLFRAVFGYVSLALALPVLVYSGSDYWKAAHLSIRQRVITLDLPIALGLAALYAQSAFEILSGRGHGYLDSLAGLVFFLLCGRVFQQMTYDRLAFDRDYKSFFPLSVIRRSPEGDAAVAISNLEVGDRLLLRNGELLPADAMLRHGNACIDYSFVTGEAEPVQKQPGDRLYAGGKQIGGSIEVEIVKPVSQSYLTSLWNDECFKKERQDHLTTLTNKYSRRFTPLVVGIAVAAAVCWILLGNPSRGLKAFTSVLIVACPCALALAAPFTLGTAQRLLARASVFLKNAVVLERLANADTVVFDKTGTLTESQANSVSFIPANSSNGELSAAEKGCVVALARQSTHPVSLRIAASLGEHAAGINCAEFSEIPGCGIEGIVDGMPMRLGSSSWIREAGVQTPESSLDGSTAALAIAGQYRGGFALHNKLRPEAERLVRELSATHRLYLLSGDTARERSSFAAMFGGEGSLNFNQSPIDKLGFIRDLRNSGRSVIMVGDGLNDAGALKESDVGIAVVEKIGTFSPASDVITESSLVPRLGNIFAFAKSATRVVRLSFALSASYNVVGVTIAAAGVLSPLICAVLMPLSSVSVVLFACAGARRAARKNGILTLTEGRA